ncbi:MAG TPA: hypothetical protein DCP28_22575, partial [Cytophagales bacterium]|nr:hypothetical protein [Cytophagales bacterium]
MKPILYLTLIWGLLLTVVCQAQLLPEVYFGYNQTDLTPASRQTLDELVQTWEAKGLAQEIVLTGYTDASGTQAYNNQLSKERARAVRNYLRQQGVTQRIEAIAKGETQLRYREDHRNRRVTISLQASP